MKVQVEVEEGTRVWAMAHHDMGETVEYWDEDAKGWYREDPHFVANGKWRLYVETPEPVTVPPGSFPWAVAHALAGKRVKRSRETSCTIFATELRFDGSSSMLDITATDWEVVNK